MMSSGSNDSESISECEFETTSESDKESTHGCYNNEPDYSQEEIDKIKESNGSASENEGSKEDDTIWEYEHTVLQMLSRRCSSNM